jgi:hypothetical protein
MPGDVIAMPDQFTEPWEVHEHSGRPLDEGAIICACVACEAAIYAQAERTPRMPLGLATAADRLVVTAEYLAEVMAADRTLAPLLYVPHDYVRRLFVPIECWWFSRPRRWWSLTCHEDEEAPVRGQPAAPPPFGRGLGARPAARPRPIHAAANGGRAGAATAP